MSQLREGSLGRLSSQEVGMPVYLSAVRMPERRRGVAGEFWAPDSDIPTRKRQPRVDGWKSLLKPKFVTDSDNAGLIELPGASI